MSECAFCEYVANSDDELVAHARRVHPEKLQRPVPVDSAPTASARELLRSMFNNGKRLIDITLKEDDAVKFAEAYASSQSSKLEGVGQEAAEKIRARYLESIAAGVKHPGPDWLEVVAKGIIDELIAGRLK